MGATKTRQSTLGFLGLTESFGVVVLMLVLLIAVSPYFGGQNLGIFVMPTLVPGVQQVLIWAGPVLLAITVALFVPVWRILKPGIPPDDDVIRWANEHGFSDPYDLGIRNYEQCLRDLGYRRVRTYR